MFIEEDEYNRLTQAYKRCKLTSEQRGNTDLTNKVFEHKNIFSTTTNLPSWVNLTEEDFMSIDFEFDIPNFLDDFIKYITAGLFQPLKHWQSELQKLRYLERLNVGSPGARASIHIQYSQEDLDSVKFWNLVEIPDVK